MEDPAQIAAKLTKAAKRTITQTRPDWAHSWNQQGHQYLTSRGLVEHITGNTGRLTPLGQSVRAILERTDDDD